MIDPKVTIIASLIYCDMSQRSVTFRDGTRDTGHAADVTVSRLLKVWLNVRLLINAENLVKYAGLADVDKWAATPGFGAAMESVGWVKVTSKGLEFPRFDEVNTGEKQQGQKTPKTAAERKREQRERERHEMSRNVTKCHAYIEDSREEENREEINNPPSTREAAATHEKIEAPISEAGKKSEMAIKAAASVPVPLQWPDKVKAAFKNWDAHKAAKCRENGKTWNRHQAEAAIREIHGQLQLLGDAAVAQAIDCSIASDWGSIVWDRVQPRGRSVTQPQIDPDQRLADYAASPKMKIDPNDDTP